VRGESLPVVNTGVTVVLPHGGNIFREKVPAAVVVGNAFGKLAGGLQVNELGELESPVVLTCTLCVGKAWDATAAWLLSLPGNEEVRSVNPLIAETNDGVLNDIRQRPISERDVLEALHAAKGGPVEEGSVGAGRGTVAFGWKGGIGTSSRRLSKKLGGWTLGVLVQSNFGGILTIAGAPVGLELGRYFLEGEAGSIIIVIATDAPLDHRELERLGRRALLGVGRTGSPNDQRFRRLCGRLLHRSRRAPAAQRRAFTAFRSDGGSDRRGDLQLAPARHYGAQRSGHGGGVAARTRSFDPQAIRRGALRQALRISITSATITPAWVRVRVRVR